MAAPKIPKTRAEFLIGLGRSLLGQLSPNAAPVTHSDVYMLRELANDIEDQLQAKQRVECDDGCRAFEYPETPEEIHKALQHWQNHSFLHGCSHGR